MQNITLFVPPQLKRTITRTATQGQQTMREVYTLAMQTYIADVKRSKREGKGVAFHAPVRPAAGAKFQMWLDDDIAATVDALADAYSISKRAFCYSALVATFIPPP